MPELLKSDCNLLVNKQMKLTMLSGAHIFIPKVNFLLKEVQKHNYNLDSLF